MRAFKTKQELFWAGKFGDEYTTRNSSKTIIAHNISFFSQILSYISPIGSVIEFGAGSGNNLSAIKQILPEIKLAAVEINPQAVAKLKKIKDVKIYHSSILNFQPKQTYDFVLVKGILIHINPSKLKYVYELLYKTSNRFICIAEYYNPTPTEIVYRGNKGFLFKRDFCGELLDSYKSLSLVKYGFSYHRDPIFPQDDITWFLLKKI
jgi:spore coat polysaccharide biosynthesis protein SpsF